MPEFLKPVLTILLELVGLGLRPQRDRAAERAAMVRANRAISDAIYAHDQENG